VPEASVRTHNPPERSNSSVLGGLRRRVSEVHSPAEIAARGPMLPNGNMPSHESGRQATQRVISSRHSAMSRSGNMLFAVSNMRRVSLASCWPLIRTGHRAPRLRMGRGPVAGPPRPSARPHPLRLACRLGGAPSPGGSSFPLPSGEGAARPLPAAGGAAGSDGERPRSGAAAPFGAPSPAPPRLRLGGAPSPGGRGPGGGRPPTDSELSKSSVRRRGGHGGGQHTGSFVASARRSYDEPGFPRPAATPSHPPL